jgi:hypothetical protein
MRAPTGTPVAVALLLAAAALAASLSRPRLDPVAQPSRVVAPSRSPEATGTAAVPAVAGADLGWLELVGRVVLVAVVAGMLVALWWGSRLRDPRLTLRPLPPARPAPPADELVAAVQAGLADLAGGDPRRAVIACWLRLEEAAGAAGVARHPYDTSTDLVLRLLRGFDVREPALAGFAELYRLARYAPHPVDERMSGRARAFLRELRDGLVRAAGPPGDRA